MNLELTEQEVEQVMLTLADAQAVTKRDSGEWRLNCSLARKLDDYAIARGFRNENIKALSYEIGM